MKRRWLTSASFRPDAWRESKYNSPMIRSLVARRQRCDNPRSCFLVTTDLGTGFLPMFRSLSAFLQAIGANCLSWTSIATCFVTGLILDSFRPSRFEFGRRLDEFLCNRLWNTLCTRARNRMSNLQQVSSLRRVQDLKSLRA